MNVAEIVASKDKSIKEQLITVLEVQRKTQYNLDSLYVPKNRYLSIAWIKDILAGRKSLLPITDIQHVPRLEKFADLTVQSLLVYAEENLLQVFNYLPDDSNPITKISRSYLINVRSIEIDYQQLGQRLY